MQGRKAAPLSPDAFMASKPAAPAPPQFTGPLIDPSNPAGSRLPTADEAAQHAQLNAQATVHGVLAATRLPGTEKTGVPGVPAPPVPPGLEGDNTLEGDIGRIMPDVQRGAEKAGITRFGSYTGGQGPGQPSLGEIGDTTLLLGTMGLSEAAMAVKTPIARRALASLSLAASGYFAKGMLESSLESLKKGVEAFQKGDYLDTIRQVGTGAIAGKLGYEGIKEFGRGAVIMEPREGYRERQAGMPPSERDLGSKGASRGPIDPEVLDPEAAPAGAPGGLGAAPEPIDVKPAKETLQERINRQRRAQEAAAAAAPAAPLTPETFMSGEAKPATPAEAAPVRATLPRELAGAKPRFNHGSKSFELQFEDDLDKASYIAAQPLRSKRDQDYVDFVAQETGLSEDEIRAHGDRVRTQIKGMTRGAEPGVLSVPPILRPAAETAPPAAAKPGTKVKPAVEPSLDLQEAPPPPEPTDKTPQRPGTALEGRFPLGNEIEAKTAKGYTVPTRYAVVPAHELITSHDDAFDENPNYPQEVQPRDRTRKSSQAQVQSIYLNVDPAELATNHKASDGAPIIGEDLVVESGNGRTMALRKLYQNQKEYAGADRYKNYMVEHARDFGLDPEDVRKMDAPVLVRVRGGELPHGVTRADFARHANESSTATMSPTEHAAADAAKISGRLMELFKPGEDGALDATTNRDFNRAFFNQVVGPNERGQYMTADGSINQQGLARIRNAIFGRAYGSTNVIERMAEHPDSNIRNITTAMLHAAPGFAKVREAIDKGTLHDRDLAPDVAAAAAKISHLRATGQTVENYLEQLGMFGDDLTPEARELVNVFHTYGRSPRKIAAILQTFTNAVVHSGNPGQAGLFGTVNVPSKAELLLGAVKVAEEEYGQVHPAIRESEPAAGGEGGAKAAPAQREPGGEEGPAASPAARPEGPRSPAGSPELKPTQQEKPAEAPAPKPAPGPVPVPEPKSAEPAKSPAAAAEQANRDRKAKIRALQQEITALQAELQGKRPPHGEVVTDDKGYAIRTKWPSNFNKADRELQGKFSRLTDAKRELSDLSREGPTGNKRLLIASIRKQAEKAAEKARRLKVFSDKAEAATPTTDVQAWLDRTTKLKVAVSLNERAARVLGKIADRWEVGSLEAELQPVGTVEQVTELLTRKEGPKPPTGVKPASQRSESPEARAWRIATEIEATDPARWGAVHRIVNGMAQRDSSHEAYMREQAKDVVIPEGVWADVLAWLKTPAAHGKDGIRRFDIPATRNEDYQDAVFFRLIDEGLIRKTGLMSYEVVAPADRVEVEKRIGELKAEIVKLDGQLEERGRRVAAAEQLAARHPGVKKYERELADAKRFVGQGERYQAGLRTELRKLQREIGLEPAPAKGSKAAAQEELTALHQDVRGSLVELHEIQGEDGTPSPLLKQAKEALQRASEKYGDKYDEIASTFGKDVADDMNEIATGETIDAEVAPPAEPAPVQESLLQEPASTAHLVANADKLIARVRQAIDSGEDLRLSYEKVANETLGGSRATGEFTKRDTYEIVEAAVNGWLVDNGARLLAMEPNAAIAELRAVLQRMPTQTVRNEDQLKRQQFSTPPTIAYVVDRVAAPRPNDVVLEPSAGIGGLVAAIKSSVAAVHLNEIEPRRAELAQAIGFDKPSGHNGEIINAELDRGLVPSLVIMNPPFSAGNLSHEGANSNKYGFNHLDSALQRLAPGGRLVALLGEGALLTKRIGTSGRHVGRAQGEASQAYFQKLAAKYNIRANVGIDGKEYAKYGTSFPTRLIVIDKTGPTPGANYIEQVSNAVTGDFKTLEEAYAALKGIAGDRPISTVEPGQAKPGAGLATRPGAVPASGGEGPGRVEPTLPAVRPEGGTGGAATPAAPVEPGARPEPAPRNEPEAPVAKPAEATPAGGAGGGAALPAESGKVVARARETAAAESDTDAYVKYVPSVEGNEHPGNIVETKTMATVALPPMTYQPSLPASLTGPGGGLSAVQLESVVLAGQQNEITHGDGARGALLIGDGTGVGKGRETASILLDNWNKGRRRLVWVSEKWDLAEDAKRDLNGIGAYNLAKGIKKHQNFSPTATIDHSGILFTTYATLRSVDKRGNRRIAQIQQWLAGADEGETGYIAFDESHNLKNTVTKGKGQVSKQGTAVAELLGALPKLRPAFASATAATDVSNLGYLGRLGLWGPQTPFPNGFGQFSSEIGTGGVAAMELIAREMKSQGKYLARTLSFRGVTYREVEHPLTPDQEEIYTKAADAWAMTTQWVEGAVQTVNGGAAAKSAFMQEFWGAHMRFFNLLITAMKVPTAIAQAQKALADAENPKSVVITLVNTNEAIQNRQKAKLVEDADEVDDLDFGPKEILIKLVQEHYPTQQWRDDVDDKGRPIKVPVYYVDETGKERPQRNPEAERQRDELVKKLEKELQVPANPLDLLIDGLGGTSKVAELTGRQERYDQGLGKFIPRGAPGTARDKVNVNEAQRFQEGKVFAAVLSNAAGTGISLHADKGAKNQRQRIHITLQVGWSADKQMQMFGRTHRTNEASQPEYVMLVSDLGGEKRFISTIAARLGTLGALTKGQRNASTGTQGTDLMEKVNFDTRQGTQAAVAFYGSLLRMGDTEKLPGTNLSGMAILDRMGVLKEDPRTHEVTVPEDDRESWTRLLNRIMALPPRTQNAVYGHFYSIFEAAVQRAIDADELDTGVKEVKGDEIRIRESRELSKDPKTGASTDYHKVEYTTKRNRVSAEDMARKLDRNKNKGAAVMLNTKTGKLRMVVDANPITRASGDLVPAVQFITPGDGGYEKTEKEMGPNWSEIEGDRAMELWQAAHDKAPTHDINEIEMIGGAVLRWWNQVRDAAPGMPIYVAQDSATKQRVVGVVVDPGSMGRLRRQIEGGGSTITHTQIFADVLRNGTPYNLAGGIQVKRGRVGRIPVVQLVPPNETIAQAIVRMGAVYEKGITPVYYLPDNAGGHAALEELLKFHPAVEDARPDRAGDADGPSFSLRPSKPDFAALASAARVTYRPGHRGHLGVVYMNKYAADAISQAYGVGFEGGVFQPHHIERLVAGLAKLAARGSGSFFDETAKLRVRDMVQAIRQAQADSSSVMFIEVRAGEKIGDVMARLRHERMHVAQRKLGGGQIAGHIDELGFLDDYFALKAARNLQERRQYSLDPVTMAMEIGAHLAGGPEHWQTMGLDRDQAKELFRRYITFLVDQHGAANVASTIRDLAPTLREVLNNATAVPQEGETGGGEGENADQGRPNGEGDGGPPLQADERAPEGQLRPGVQRGVSGEAELDLGFDSGAQREAEGAQQRQLAGDRLTAEFNSQLQPGNLRKKLKKAPPAQQLGIFAEPPAPRAPTLFDDPEFARRAAGPILPGQPARPSQQIGIRAAVKRLDMPDRRIRELTRKVSGQQEASKLTRDQAAELLTILSSTYPNGKPVEVGGVTPWNQLESPSIVLAQSRHGARIYDEAQRQFFEQERLSDRFTRNYQKVTKGLTKDEKDQIARFRLKLDENGKRPHEGGGKLQPLSPKLQQISEQLTRLVFEPMFQMGVAKKLISEDRHINDYLAYYRDDAYKVTSRGRRDMAANLAQELGIDLGMAEKILDQANLKKVTFGSFDYARLAETTPGLRDLDNITQIYVKGFARKVAVTAFLEVANRERPNIVDEGLRQYAKAYIDQYAGKPSYSAADDWMERKKNAVPWLRDKKLSAARIAGIATAVQYHAKLGFNLFSPILNLTQTIINTVPAAGAIRTFGVLPKGAAAVLLPNALNPFVRDMGRLRRSGVLDSLMTKFERPQFTGLTEKGAKALGFLFEKTEQFNRATAFLAGYTDAIEKGLKETDAIAAGRAMVRTTQFFSGRLDAPLFSRTPIGKVVMQFKTFTIKEVEFVRDLPPAGKAKFALWSVLLGGLATLGIVQALTALLGKDSDVVEMIDEFQETWNVAGFLGADHLAKQFGIYIVPGLEDVGRRDFKARLLTWAAGPTIATILDIVDASMKDRDRTEKVVAAVVRGVVPGGAEMMRVKRAMTEADSPEEALRLLFGFYRDNKQSTASDAELRKLLRDPKGNRSDAEINRLLGVGSTDPLLRAPKKKAGGLP